MNNLTVVDYQNQKTIDSRKIAEMIGMLHKDLLEKIRGYIQILSSGKFRSTDYFISETYQDALGRIHPCFLVTRKGCDMIANKLIGKKGVLFTAAYVDEFHEMKEAPGAALALPMDPLDLIIMQAKAAKELQQEVRAQGQQIKIIEAKMITSPTEYFTIAGYANLRGIKVDLVKASMLGRRAAKLSAEYGYDVGKINDPRFGQVNTYHVDILSEVFDPSVGTE